MASIGNIVSDCRMSLVWPDPSATATAFYLPIRIVIAPFTPHSADETRGEVLCKWKPDNFDVEFDLDAFEKKARYGPMPPLIGRDGPAGYVPCYGSTAIQTVTVQTPEGGQVYFDLCRNVKERLGIGRRALLCVWIRVGEGMGVFRRRLSAGIRCRPHRASKPSPSNRTI